jgi:hypothetical protein
MPRGKYERSPELRAQASRKATKHGGVGSSEYAAWRGILDRCLNERSPRYKYYGGRGITVCERWYYFKNFLLDMGQKPELSYSIERKDNSGNYEPENCIWAAPKTQANNRRSNRLIAHEGCVRTLAQWAESAGLLPNTLKRRLDKLKWPMARALTEPVHKE